jgi:hypothetical protein
MPVQVAKLKARHIALPAWLLSLLVHFGIFGTMAGLTWSLEGEGSGEEFEVSIVVKETLGDEQTAFRGPDDQVITPPEAAPPPPKEVADDVPAELLTPRLVDTLTDVNPIAVPTDALSDVGRLRVSIPAPSASAGMAKTRFFGVVTRGTKFVYVLDRSASMTMGADKMEIAKRELMRSLRKLPASARFQIIFYNQHPQVMRIGGSLRLAPATPRNLAIAEAVIAKINADGMTKPRPALMKAIALGADVIFFLTDAQEMSPKVVADVNLRNRRYHQAKIHAIEISDGMPWQDESRQVAALVRQNNGAYKYINALEYVLDEEPDEPSAPSQPVEKVE